MGEESAQVDRIRRILTIAALGGLALLLYSIIHPFVVALTWAVILAVSLWPLYRWLRKRVPGRAPVAPLLMVFLIALGLIVPVVVVGFLVVSEAQVLLEDVKAVVVGDRGDLEGLLRGVPIWGESLAEALIDLRERGDAFDQILETNKANLLGVATRAMGDLLQNVFKITVCLFTVYFLFRHGELLAEQTKRGVHRLGGDRMESLLPRIASTVSGVVYGLLMTALMQGLLAAIGFWVAGVPFPFLLGLLTFLLSFIPFGPPVAWLPASLSLLAEGRYLAGFLLLLWGAGAISTMDNILRPIFIGRATQLPVLLVFMGVVGGVMSFGMVGLFVGPVILAVALALWNDWVARRETDLSVLDGIPSRPFWGGGAGRRPAGESDG